MRERLHGSSLKTASALACLLLARPFFSRTHYFQEPYPPFKELGLGVQRRGGDSRIVVMFEVGNFTPYEPRMIRE